MPRKFLGVPPSNPITLKKPLLIFLKLKKASRKSVANPMWYYTFAKKFRKKASFLNYLKGLIEEIRSNYNNLYKERYDKTTINRRRQNGQRTGRG